MSATEFGDLAARMSAGVAGVRACLILSRDGLSLGAHPADGEARARKAWDALQQIGDPQRGFVDMGDEIWVVSARGAYAAIIVGSPEAKPGVLLDRMEAELAAVDLARAAEDSPAGPADTRSRPRSPLHPEPRLEVKAKPVPVSAGSASRPVVDLLAAEPKKHPDPPKRPAKPNRRGGKPGGVDRVALAREFGRLMDDQASEGY
ncbi:MAG: hypothetical protein ACRDHM_09640 [Actinomycetota bacterium]